ncbi:Protein BREVIS RADIX [Rhynchospora pubera]|uniref:Protein BREVIS RADIX n=1 Tax=Rhynchospora pubera TaxID=906938 RepID=A0AAV8H5Q8_9POAL|nr:Protein BREVIS RADIX [Rhynchospora pubera]
MLACIACSKEAGEGSSRSAATPGGVKSLTSQLKDMVLKFSGSNRQCKGGIGSTSFRSKPTYHHRRTGSYSGADDGSLSDSGIGSYPGNSYTYMRGTSSGSTPAWDFSHFNSDPRFTKSGWVPREENEVVVVEDNGEPKEWTAQIEPGVQITFVSLPGGAGNDLKRIRFSREMFNKWQAQRWWGENYDRIVELYNVQRFSRQGLPTPPRSDDGQRESFYSRVGSTRENPAVTPPLGKELGSRAGSTYRPSSTASCSGKGMYYAPSGSVPDPTDHIFGHHFNLNSAPGTGALAMDAASRATTSSRDEASVSVSNASDLEVTEWIEEDQPGVYVTIRELGDGTRELRRIRFSREKFGEERAKLWWEENRERIQSQYL